MDPVRRNLAVISAVHRSRTCRGTSASTADEAGQLTSLHPVHSAFGFLPILCRYWADPAQWPARSWWTSTAENRSRSTTGVGRRSPIKSRYHPLGRCLQILDFAALAAARTTVLTSTGTFSSPARRLAGSLAGRSGTGPTGGAVGGHPRRQTGEGLPNVDCELLSLLRGPLSQSC